MKTLDVKLKVVSRDVGYSWFYCYFFRSTGLSRRRNFPRQVSKFIVELRKSSLSILAISVDTQF